MGIRQEQREKRKQEILEAALDLFISKGYSETKVSDIAKKVNMSMGLLFHYFESKAKLYEELIHIGLMGPASAMEIDDSDPLRFFEMVAAYVISALRDNPFVAKMFVLMLQIRFRTDLPEPLKSLIEDSSQLEKSVAIIEAGQARGQIRQGDPAALAILFWQALSGVALYAAVVPDGPIPEAEWIIDCIRRKE